MASLLPVAALNATAFGEGAIPWSALQSLYALARSSGLSSAPAALLQAILSIGVVLVVARIDRRAPSHALRHAAMCAGTILVTPFLLVWDLPIIGVGMAFLFAGMRQDRMSPTEAAALICLTGSTIVVFSLDRPVGCFDGLLLLLLVWRRCREAWSPRSTAGPLDLSPAIASIG